LDPERHFKGCPGKLNGHPELDDYVQSLSEGLRRWRHVYPLTGQVSLASFRGAKFSIDNKCPSV
jgi:hypothetical protein